MSTQPIHHYENFPVASLLCPPALRAPISAIYHFARTADDLADEGHDNSAKRLQDLQAYRQQLALASDNTTPVPRFSPRWASVFVQLQSTIAAFGMDIALLDDLLQAFEQDVAKTRDGASYATDQELLAYCRKSANPVGRMLLHLYGVQDPLSLAHSDAICTALQLANFWQDLSVDIPRGRYYVTQEMLARSGASWNDILAQKPSAQVDRLVRQCVAAARESMLRGLPLVHRIQGRAGWELRMVVQGGLRILEKVEKLQGHALRTRARLYAWDYLILLWRACWM